MSIDEGYIKYKCNWSKSKIELDDIVLSDINTYRDSLVQWNMIGKIPDGPGFGNLSLMADSGGFFISGTNTGHLNTLQAAHMALVNKVSINENTVWCSGELQASSESMTHAAIYNKLETVKAVIHIHHKQLWEKLMFDMPTTDKNIPYGTPEMALAVAQKCDTMDDKQLLILGGHEDGIISFGSNMQHAFDKIKRLEKIL